MSRWSKSTRLIHKVNELIESEQSTFFELYVLHSRLKAVKAELSAHNVVLETIMTDEHVVEDCDSILEYEDSAISALALLEHHMERLNASSLPAVTEGDQPATPYTKPLRPHRELGAQLCKLELQAKAGSSVRHILVLLLK